MSASGLEELGLRIQAATKTAIMHDQQQQYVPAVRAYKQTVSLLREYLTKMAPSDPQYVHLKHLHDTAFARGEQLYLAKVKNQSAVAPPTI